MNSSEFLSKYDVGESQYQQFGIKPQRAMLQIIEVELQPAQHFLHCVRIALYNPLGSPLAMNLRKSDFVYDGEGEDWNW